MKILLPPSETKRPDGDAPRLNVDTLALPGLREVRERVIDALVALSRDEDEAARVLGLSMRQRGDIARNAQLRTAPTMAAVDRYTGVLYDALAAETLGVAARRWLGAHVWIHSAPFGPVSALDRIPAYRLAAGTSLPALPPLRRLWSDRTSAEIAAADPGFVIDLRSKAYVALGPVPVSVPSVYIHVVTEKGQALNHFNKKAKGELMRALAEDRPLLDSAAALGEWGTGRGILLRASVQQGAWELVVPT